MFSYTRSHFVGRREDNRGKVNKRNKKEEKKNGQERRGRKEGRKEGRKRGTERKELERKRRRKEEEGEVIRKVSLDKNHVQIWSSCEGTALFSLAQVCFCCRNILPASVRHPSPAQLEH